ARGITDTSKSSYYWLASRYVDYQTGNYFFIVRYASSSGVFYSSLYYRLCDVGYAGDVHSFSSSRGVRPVFSLKSTVKIKEGVGTGKTPETAFELEVQ
ncbi:MAG: hypothetical protein ACI4VQ_04065, partial [Clostridia bacterium]